MEIINLMGDFASEMGSAVKRCRGVLLKMHSLPMGF